MMQNLSLYIVGAIFLTSFTSSVQGDCDLVINGFTLMNVTTKRTISPLQDFIKESSNAVIAIRANPGSCNTTAGRISKVKSVFVDLDGTLFKHCETYTPYTIFGDPSTMDVANNVAKYNGYSLRVGTHTVSATPYDGERCTGNSGPKRTKQFIVKNRVRTPVRTPVRVPVKAPVRVPTPIRTPVRVPTPVRTPVKVPVKSPVKPTTSSDCKKGLSTVTYCRFKTVDTNNIRDPSFEEYKRCPTERFQINLSKRWVSGTEFKPDYWVGAPTCNDTIWRDGSGKGSIGDIVQNATDGTAFVGTLKLLDSYTYIGTCLENPFVKDIEYELTMDIAAAKGDVDTLGGNTNGITDILCIPNCNQFPIKGNDYKGDTYEILGTAQPNRGLVGGGNWKRIKFNFTPKRNCPGIMIGASKLQTSSNGFPYVLYDNIKLKEVIKGICNDDGRCISRQD